MPRRPAIADTIAALRKRIQGYRNAGEKVALVPTMGALHAGHLALVKHGQKKAERVVVSIFVNPTQFAPTEDFSSYPRTFESDCAKLAEAKADLVWAPKAVTIMYPPDFSTHIAPSGPASVGLEDKFRPHFFGGVATVVSKLLLQNLPDFAIFGEKDFQQLRVVEKMVADLDIPVKIIGAPTVREKDGLAMSSRNVYLSEEHRAIAPLIHRTLRFCAEDIRAGTAVSKATEAGQKSLEQAGFAVDYLEARETESLKSVADKSDAKLRLLVAAKIGKTRLIDNIAV
ncbi:pantothenate synthetase [Variibacter gotjawalensis]|uniref:Pantothenate synthetase n=1 Tax=Variibacter gotjawalensis TaxID=1333996 RepID=A0A0S3PXZ1_9BRAD|nr:pantoate--beta-alanine ligase [Variibacter gotjawalensis]NIK46652.1 pantoate--beta-alanine ligase [Variibacter gotjawalensis]RZS48555.1 pantothenate synthetase [Variibacter gotjawalensis]BAT60817.1 pantothenate synthetase [Variibacter gotjawalensis]